MTTTVNYYGMLAEKLNISSETITIQVNQEKFNLRNFFEDLHPELKSMSYQVAVNQEITNTIEPTQSIQEIALLPPFAGG
jgi:molybdopterin converting factor small subunit